MGKVILELEQEPALALELEWEANNNNFLESISNLTQGCLTSSNSNNNPNSINSSKTHTKPLYQLVIRLQLVVMQVALHSIYLVE
jgi:hypothetical protein